jgi:outer membrane protein assembly factor BamE (lipoprotein component of BamABCDE complex)
VSRFSKFVVCLAVLVVFLPALIPAYYYGVRGYSAEDSFYSLTMCRLTDTAWAEGYSEKKFAKITVGMNREEVRSIIGEPIWKPSSNYWGYTHSPTGTHYHQRGFVFSESGQVVEIVKGFYYD